MGKELGVIEVSMRYSATLEFNQNISKIIFGYNPVKATRTDSINKTVNTVFEFYNYAITGKITIIQAAAMNTPETTVTIILQDNTVYSGIIRYTEEPKKFYYSFVIDQATTTNQPVNNVAPVRDFKSLNPEQRFLSVLEDKNKYSFAAVNSKVYCIVTNIKNDDESTYIKLMIVNESARDYLIESISFIKVTEIESTFQRKEVLNSEYIDPKEAVYPYDNIVKANSSNRLGFILPLYSTTEKGKMIIQILEKNGTRNVDLEITAKELAKIDVF